MGLPIISAIAAHKLAAVLLVASIGISGGAVAASGNGSISNVVGELSFIIKPSSTNVTQVASLNLGTLVVGESGTQSSTAVINFTNAGTYGLALENLPVLEQVFSVFNVTVTGLSVASAGVVMLNFQHPSQSITITTTGPDTLVVSLLFTVSSGPTVQRGLTVSDSPFLALAGVVPIPVNTPTVTTQVTGTS